LRKSKIPNPKSLPVRQAGKKEKKLKEEIGDLLFSVVNVARKLDIDAEESLQMAVSKFMRRFGQIEAHARGKKIDLGNMSLKEMDRVWEEVKKKERN